MCFSSVMGEESRAYSREERKVAVLIVDKCEVVLMAFVSSFTPSFCAAQEFPVRDLCP